MAIIDTFSKRRKRLELAGKSEVLSYDPIPSEFRVQVVHIWKSAIGQFYYVSRYQTQPASNAHWQSIHDMLARERGAFSFGRQDDDPFAQCQQFILNTDTDGVLDIVELTFRYIDKIVRNQGWDNDGSGITQNADDAMEELNHRFWEHSLGYQFVEDKLVRVDSQFMHSEVVLPAISLLNQ